MRYDDIEIHKSIASDNASISNKNDEILERLEELSNNTNLRFLNYKTLGFIFVVFLIIVFSAISYIYISTPKVIYKDRIVKVQDDTLVAINKKQKKDIANLKNALNSKTPNKDIKYITKEVPVERIVYKDKIVKVKVPVVKEKIVYRDKIVKVPVVKEKIVYKDRIIKAKADVTIEEYNELVKRYRELLKNTDKKIKDLKKELLDLKVKKMLDPGKSYLPKKPAIREMKDYELEKNIYYPTY